MVMTKYQKRVGNCKGPKCQRPILAKGLCNAHYKQMRDGRKRLKPITEYGRRTDSTGNIKECVFEGCTHKIRAAGYCTGHYKQKYDGRPLAPLMKNSRTAGRYDDEG